MRIEINYSDPVKPRGVVGGPVNIPLNGHFTFFSNDGPVEVEFIDQAPFPAGAGQRFAGDYDFIAASAGNYKFKCFVTTGNAQVELSPNSPEGGGGELMVGS